MTFGISRMTLTQGASSGFQFHANIICGIMLETAHSDIYAFCALGPTPLMFIDILYKPLKRSDTHSGGCGLFSLVGDDGLVLRDVGSSNTAS